VFVKIETASMIAGGAPRRRVLFSDDTARRVHGSPDTTRAGIWKDARDWASWASRLVHRRPDAQRLAPRPEDGEVEVR